MSKAVKEALSFEGALGRLEEIVSQMESSELPLESIIGKYEEGMKLLVFCEQKLEAAEKKIELLTRDKAGKVQRMEMDAGEGPVEGTKDESSSEVSLF